MTWYGIYLCAWLVAALLSAGAVRICMPLAAKWGFEDIPKHEAHKNHRKATPVLGGLGMLLGWLGALLGGYLGSRALPGHWGEEVSRVLPGLSSVAGRLAVIVIGACAITLVGVWDDRRAMKAGPKFLLQAVVTLGTAWCGLHFSFLHAIPGANWLLSALWMMVVINALNFFDNMDGLAAGTAAIAAFFLLFVAALRGQNFVGVLAALTGGVACGFLVFNTPPARIFMGDGGSHLLGYLLAICGLLTTYYIPSENATPAPLLIPLFALGVPLFDAMAVVVIRLRLGVPIYKGDNRHISHRFARLGLSRPQAVLVVHLLCFVVGVTGLMLLWLPPAGALLALALVSAIFTVISIIQFYVPAARVPAQPAEPSQHETQ
ncbi:MAG: undecaprenyl/decaprenyl-phosphate alpha-N-acetylglucosaminyl 1-phosphate transferase [Victivallales bacterium]|nr:undecaprenyl/decaprenyl-phosphate alpha-N-acetylglucosaminyl 1-phosphate transferase [Victivallales bacterium]